MEDNILRGPKPTYPLEDGSAGEYLYKALKKHRNIRTCMTNSETGITISYNELLNITCRLAESFKTNGYPMNTVISVCCENNYCFMYPVIAALYGGLIVAPTSFHYTERELLHSFNISKPKIIFCSKAQLPKIAAVKRKLSFIHKIVILNSTENTEDAESLNNFITRGSDADLDIDNYKTAEFDRDQQVATIMSSSGTTGLPKGVMLTHKNLMVRFNHIKDPQCCIAYHLKPGGELVIFMPLYHSFGFSTTLENLSLGFHMILMETFTEELFLSLIEKHKVETLLIVPAVMLFLVKSPLVDKYDLSSLTELVVGSAPSSVESINALKERLNIKHIRQGYGLTENTLVSFLSPLNNRKFASSGKILPFVEAKIIDLHTQKTVGPNTVGELCLKGELLMKGYAGDIKATKNTIDKDGWLHTGDVAYLDKDGDLYVVDRIKELIKYKGFQVAPAELEGILLQHPKIFDAAVIGMPDLIAGELPTAFVVTQPNSILSEKEVQDFVKDKVSPSKRLRGGVRFINEIPKNPTGKIMRKQLLQLLQNKSKL